MTICRERISQHHVDLFWSKVRILLPTECWEWTAGRFNTGYGAFKWEGQNRQAHRMAYAMTHDAAPHGMFVCHHCDNPPCCNPLHLFLGTPRDNMHDMIRKGRQRIAVVPKERRFDIGSWRVQNMPFRGSSHPQAKLNEATVSLIKQAIRTGERGVDISARFGCSVYTVSNIKLGKQWSHVE